MPGKIFEFYFLSDCWLIVIFSVKIDFSSLSWSVRNRFIWVVSPYPNFWVSLAHIPPRLSWKFDVIFFPSIRILNFEIYLQICIKKGSSLCGLWGWCSSDREKTRYQPWRKQDGKQNTFNIILEKFTDIIYREKKVLKFVLEMGGSKEEGPSAAVPVLRRDPYEVLCVSRDSSDQEIKTAYKKLALK